MKTSSVLRELIKRQVNQKLDKPREDKEVASLKRSLFLQKVMESDGNSLLDYIEVSSLTSDKCACKDVFDHIKKKAETSLNKAQTSLVKHYLAKLGVKVHKTSNVSYFTHVKLKDQLCQK